MAVLGDVLASRVMAPGSPRSCKAARMNNPPFPMRVRICMQRFAYTVGQYLFGSYRRSGSGKDVIGTSYVM